MTLKDCSFINTLVGSKNVEGGNNGQSMDVVPCTLENVGFGSQHQLHKGVQVFAKGPGMVKGRSHVSNIRSDHLPIAVYATSV